MNARSECPLEWGDERLAVASDPAMRAEHRLHQSWYREHELGACYGTYGKGAKQRPVGSLFAPAEVAKRPSLNFLELEHVLAYVDKRVPEVRAEGGTLQEARLRHNMLSSMPMAFTLAALLRSAGDAADIVGRLFGVDCGQVTAVDAEWAPDPKLHLQDRTAFDLVIHYETSTGSAGVIGVETKYTEPLSPREYDTGRYRQVTDQSSWYLPGSADVLKHSATNQLWRNSMLAASMEANGDVAVAHLGVVGLDCDASLWKAVGKLQQQCAQPDRVVAVSWEQLLQGISQGDLAREAGLMAARYIPGEARRADNT